ncbi:hypothetical protein [Acinetobacter gerneri]|uniref:Uncharacterized protein n=2 Tax=Acinetobacter gerneri TaxID=202952 RepID=N8ZEK5_9GAMM|nr:hypothetical protein [Acinetobacter gerneri]ENV32184.1 hypothetical protein F960_03570 [Acinetobacter gerneri DSM 14967 = CIP 107464 = MTCC 9824]MDQ9010733.1 hypothetical protein [Acinetobacter gerneri]MDQ9014441.1 hypothetical protein [Acinetobacter gerneri]MDQ9025612.1 hypothetical protein [Acinetobacter gerneri]MDQ9052893.1 hypothetical protein [Acinetobacter gerneri]
MFGEFKKIAEVKELSTTKKSKINYEINIESPFSCWEKLRMRVIFHINPLPSPLLKGKGIMFSEFFKKLLR